MKKAGMDLYYIPMSDYHASAYVSDYFRCIEYMTGFTGSAGHVLVSMDDACFCDIRCGRKCRTYSIGVGDHILSAAIVPPLASRVTV